MYRGKRDPEIRIVVMQKHCAEYKSKQNLKFIEIFIPPEDIHDYNSQWARTKQGKARPWLLRSAPLVAVTGIKARKLVLSPQR